MHSMKSDRPFAAAACQIYWPLNCQLENNHGWIIGWNLQGFLACVSCVISNDSLKLDMVESALESVLSSDHPAVKHMLNDCGGEKPFLMGYYHGKSKINSEQLRSLQNSKHFWINIVLSEDKIPMLDSLYCCGYRYQGLSAEFVYYKPPSAHYLQHYSIDPLRLDVGPPTESESNDDDLPAEIGDYGVPKPSQSDYAESHLTECLMQHACVTKKQRPPSWDLKIIIEQMNAAQEIEELLLHQLKATEKNFIAFPRAINMASPVKKTIDYLTYGLFYIMGLIFVCLRMMSEGILWIISVDLPFGIGSLTSVSAICQQIDLRLQQICHWPCQALVFSEPNWRYSSWSKAQYINFYNNMWLVLNDIIIGMALGALVLDHIPEFSQWIQDVHEYYGVQVLRQTIVWLMGWPAGLKLNSSLDRFLGELFLWIIHIWTAFIGELKQFATPTVEIIGMSGILGASMMFSMVSDLVMLLSVHVWVFYGIAAKIYHWQLSVLESLFYLFRGKKWNVLRERLDSCDYGVDQLLLGTILFTLLFFLLPTVVVYYVLFCAARMVVVTVQILLKSCLAFLNHFPLFALMLYVKDPFRLPGGVQFSIVPDGKIITTKAAILRKLSRVGASASSPSRRRSPWKVVYLHVQSVPIAVHRIFFQYLLLWRRLARQYLTWSVISRLLRGLPIRTVPLLQYPMLPAKRISPGEFWDMWRERVLVRVDPRSKTDSNQKID